MKNASVLLADDLVNKVVGENHLQDLAQLPCIEDCRRLIAAVNAEAHFTPEGLALADAWIQRLLRNRLLMERELRKHPEIRDEVLAPPLVITGFPRSGTTKLQRMMSAAPCFQALWFWRMRNLVPFPGTARNDPDPRMAEAISAQEVEKLAHPAKWAAHPAPATDVDEDLSLQDFTFLAPTLAAQLGAPRYRAELTPVRPQVYEFERLALQYLQWQDGAANRASRPWILKSPIHLGSIATLLRVFPNAKIVHCHRDVAKSVASLVRLAEEHEVVFTNSADRAKRGETVCREWSNHWARNIEQRRQLDPNSYCDVQFEEINQSAITVAERICAFIGIELDQQSRAAMLQWEATNERHKHGKHVYSLEEYALPMAQVRQAFDVYFGHFAGTVIAAEPARP